MVSLALPPLSFPSETNIPIRMAAHELEQQAADSAPHYPLPPISTLGHNTVHPKTDRIRHGGQR
jgi:hypothetical protein